MGQKVNPTGLRLGVNRTWDSRWYADDKFTDYLHEDLKIKEFLKEKLAQAGVSRIVIERPAKKARVTIHSARPGAEPNLFGILPKRRLSKRRLVLRKVCKPSAKATCDWQFKN